MSRLRVPLICHFSGSRTLFRLELLWHTLILLWCQHFLDTCLPDEAYVKSAALESEEAGDLWDCLVPSCLLWVAWELMGILPRQLQKTHLAGHSSGQHHNEPRWRWVLFQVPPCTGRLSRSTWCDRLCTRDVFPWGCVHGPRGQRRQRCDRRQGRR